MFRTGLSYPDLYQKCRECFYVNSDVALRAQLTEFCDHKLIRVKKVHFTLIASSSSSFICRK